MPTQFRGYQGQRELVLKALKKKFQSTLQLQETTGLPRPQIAVALSRLREDGLVESQKVRPKTGGHPFNEHRLTGLKPVKVETVRAPSQAVRERQKPAKLRAGTGAEKVLQALSETEPRNVRQLENLTGMPAPTIRYTIHYLALRGYAINTAYRPDEVTGYPQPVAYYTMEQAQKNAA